MLPLASCHFVPRLIPTWRTRPARLRAEIAACQTTSLIPVARRTSPRPRGDGASGPVAFDRAEYLLYEGLTAGTEMPASDAAKPDFADRCIEHFTNTWPIARWLVAEVAN